MSAPRARTALGCLGLLCFPVAVVLTLYWMRHHERVGFYVGSGAVILLGLLCVLLWLGWWVKNKLTGPLAQAAQLRTKSVPPLQWNRCRVCQKSPASYFCEVHMCRVCADCVSNHATPGVCRWWINPESAEVVTRYAEAHARVATKS